MAAAVVVLASLLVGSSAAPAPTEPWAPKSYPVIEAAKAASPAAPYSFVDHTIIYSPRTNEVLGFPRIAELSDGTLLVACTMTGYNPPFIPIFGSSDGGVTWAWQSNVGVGGEDSDDLEKGSKSKVATRQAGCDPDDDDCCDPTDPSCGGGGDCDPDDPSCNDDNPVGLGAQPALMQLTQDMGNFTAGTILAAGNRMEFDSTNIDLYYSNDTAKSWNYITTIATGGPPHQGNGGTPIWEPFLMEYEGQVVCYYSDSRDTDYGQKLSHQMSPDLYNWADPVDDVTYPNYVDRPGMTIVAYIPPLDKYMLVFEHGNGTRSIGGNAYPDLYRQAANPLQFENATTMQVEATGYYETRTGVMEKINVEPGSSPYVVWSPVGGVNGTIIMADANHRDVFINRMLGAEDAWEARTVVQPGAYARALHVLKNHTDHLAIVGAGPYQPRAGDRTPLSLSVVNITELINQKM